MWYIYTMEYYPAIKRVMIPFAATSKPLEIITLSKVSQTNRHQISLICGI